MGPWLIDDEDRKETARTKTHVFPGDYSRPAHRRCRVDALFVYPSARASAIRAGRISNPFRALLITTITPVVSLAVLHHGWLVTISSATNCSALPDFHLRRHRAFPEDRVERSVDPTIGMDLLEPQDFAEKFFTNCREILQDGLPRLGGSWVTAFFLVGLLLPFRNPGLSRLRFFVVLSLVLFIGIEALGRTHLTTDSPVINSENLLVVFAPLVFMFGAALFFILLEQLSAANLELRFVSTAFFVLIAACLTFSPFCHRQPIPSPRPIFQILSNALRTG